MSYLDLILLSRSFLGTVLIFGSSAINNNYEDTPINPKRPQRDLRKKKDLFALRFSRES